MRETKKTYIRQPQKIRTLIHTRIRNIQHRRESIFTRIGFSAAGEGVGYGMVG